MHQHYNGWSTYGIRNAAIRTPSPAHGSLVLPGSRLHCAEEAETGIKREGRGPPAGVSPRSHCRCLLFPAGCASSLRAWTRASLTQRATRRWLCRWGSASGGAPRTTVAARLCSSRCVPCGPPARECSCSWRCGSLMHFLHFF